MANVLIIHPDPAVRARLVEALEHPERLGGRLDQPTPELHEVASLDEAARREERPVAIVTYAPPGTQAVADRNDRDGRGALPEPLRTVPRVIVIEAPDPWQLSAALSLRPAGVVLPTSDPDLVQGAVGMALHDTGVVMDSALTPVAAQILRMNMAQEFAED